MKKRLIGLLCVATLLLTTMLTACSNGSPSTGGGNSGGEAGSGDGTGTSGESYHITMAYLGQEWEDQQKVWDAVNELTKAELNMTVDFIVLGFGDYIEKLNLMLSGGDTLDILPVYYTQANAYISQGQIVNLADYLYDQGKDIITAVGEDIATAGKMGDFIYGIPSQKESASGAGIVMRKDIVEELDIDVDSISTFADITAVFEVVSAAHPELTMISGANTIIEKIEYADPLYDYFGVLMDNGQSRTVENYFETDWYREHIEIVSDWYQRGWVKSDAATTTETSQALMKAGTLFSYMSAIKPGFAAQEQANTGHEVATAYIGNEDGTPINNLWTNSVNFFNWGIAANSENPAKAMEFLNFAYTSPEFNNLLNFGIEGEHYDFVDGSDIVINFPQGVDGTTTTYNLNMGWHLPNQFLGYIWEGFPADVWDQYMAFNDSATKSIAFGFAYDSSPVITELTALENVKSQYKYALECGSAGANWEAQLDAFNNALYAAGLQTVMDEKQRQLDEWLAA